MRHEHFWSLHTTAGEEVCQGCGVVKPALVESLFRTPIQLDRDFYRDLLAKVMQNSFGQLPAHIEIFDYSVFTSKERDELERLAAEESKN